MPVLPTEPAHFPESLFADERPRHGPSRCWSVLHTRPRQEKSLARQLCAGGVPFFLPLVARRSLVRGRIVTSYNPLFSGYLFLLAHERERVAALRTHRVVSTLGVSDQDGFWNDLRQVHRLIESGAPITPEDRLAPGMLVEVRTGPLAGLRGTVIRSVTGRRLVVRVNFIQQGASIELDDFILTRVDG